ncbi:hypothetical protein [Actinospica robiniae]|uniref:hypothetical protein n=1 Tax=Actinospica robiniae TaxID=304901 RepID=UPI000413D716|nr:hypothetical protein [Actinospica robiniae]
MANPFKVIGDSLLGRLVPTWQAKADYCRVVRNVNEGSCWEQWEQCEKPSGYVYCYYNLCSGQIITYAGVC